MESIINLLKRGLLLILGGLFVLFSCTKSKSLAVITVAEQSGLERKLEYVRAIIPIQKVLKQSDRFFAVDEDNVVVPIQITDTIINGKINNVNIVFPVSMEAKETKKFRIELNQMLKDTLSSDLHYSDTEYFIENEHYIAHFGLRKDKRGGQVLNLTLKDYNNVLLHRYHKVPIHWAPNFSKSDSKRYYTLESLSLSSKNILKGSGPYTITKTRIGTSDSVPEINVKGRYTFYAGLPFFEFSSTMTVTEEVELNLLRNDEMTMDSLFTHIVFVKNDDSILNLDMYNDELDVLEKEHITDDAPWLAFYNKDKKYGFGSIRLEFDNANMDGELSPLHKPYTKISKSADNGRYWNRILIADTIVSVPIGSRYLEKNAYLIFNAKTERPEDEVIYYADRLKNPLVVTLEKN